MRSRVVRVAVFAVAAGAASVVTPTTTAAVPAALPVVRIVSPVNAVAQARGVDGNVPTGGPGVFLVRGTSASAITIAPCALDPYVPAVALPYQVSIPFSSVVVADDPAGTAECVKWSGFAEGVFATRVAELADGPQPSFYGYQPVTPFVAFDGVLSGRDNESSEQRLALSGLGQLSPSRAGIVVLVQGERPAGRGAANVTIQDCGGRERATADRDMPTIAILANATEVCAYGAPPTSVRITVLGVLDGSSSSSLLPRVEYEPYDVSPPGLVARSPIRILDTRTSGRPEYQGKTDDQVVPSPADVPVGAARSLAWNVTATGAIEPGYLSAARCYSNPQTSSVNFAPGQTVANAVLTEWGACLHRVGRTDVIVDLAGYYAYGDGAGLEPISPVRLLDTRRSGAVVPAGGVLRVRPADLVTPPDGGASAVAVNLTATDAQAPGYLTAYPCDVERPLASTLNFLAGQTIPNSAVVKLSPSGELCIYSYSATHVIVDLAGYYGDEVWAGVQTAQPRRIIDTRNAGGRTVEAGQTLEIDVAGSGAVPTDAPAVFVNLTSANAAAPGFLTAYPCDRPVPLASNVNYQAATAAANGALVKLSATGRLCVFSFARSDVIVDVTGYVDEEVYELSDPVLFL